MPNRIVCLNDPVNFVDPEGLDIEVNVFTDKKIKEELKKADLPDWAKDPFEGLAEFADSCIHHTMESEIDLEVTIKPDVDLEDKKVEIEVEIPF